MLSQETRLFLIGTAAITGAGFLWIFPGLNLLVTVAAVAGLLLIVARLGYFRGALASIPGIVLVGASGAIPLGVEFGILSAIIFTMLAIIPGFAMGVAARGFASPERTVWYGLIPILLLFAFSSIYFADTIKNLPTIKRQVNSMITQTLDRDPNLSRVVDGMYGSGVDAQDKFLKEFDDLIDFFFKIMPGTMLISFVGIIVISLAAAGAVAERFKIMIPRLRPFYLWRASEWWLFPTLLGLFLVVAMQDQFWRYLGGNILIITGNIYAVAGLAVTEASLRRFAAPAFMRAVFYVIILLTSMMGFGLVILAILGLADSRFNFKRELPENEERNIE